MAAITTPMSILLVEDNALQRRQLEAQLQPLGHRMLAASNGQEALERLRLEPPDLIIMDVVMPSMDGFKACEAIKGDPRTAAIPIIVLTALSRDAKDRSYAAGADDFLRKPAPTLLLQVRVQTHLRIHALSRSVGNLPDARPKVLVASGSPLVRAQVQNHFGKDQGTFLEAPSEGQARAQILAHRPDVLVLDTELQEGSSQTLASAIQQADELAGMPILLLHAGGELELWSKFREPLSDAMEKPLVAPETRRRLALLARLAHLRKLTQLA